MLNVRDCVFGIATGNVVGLTTVNSSGVTPVDAVPVTIMSLVPQFVSITGCSELIMPVITAPKCARSGLAAMPPAIAVPLIATSWFAMFGMFVTIVSVPMKSPGALGFAVTVAVMSFAC